MMQSIYEFGGSGQVMNLALANGFPPPTYKPLLQPFTTQYRVICTLPRALWSHDEQPPTHIDNWREGLARDLLEGIRTHDLQDIVAVGHSFGGIASLLTVIEAPERFKALILLDPTIFSTERIEQLDTLRAQNAIEQMPLAARAIKRQRDFANVDEAFAYFRGKPLFADWSDEVLHLYTSEGTRPNADGGVTLTWSPEWEAYYFKGGYTKIWDDLPRLRGLVPTLIIRGVDSDTYVAESAERVKVMLPEATHIDMAGHGHLFPQSNPAGTYGIMEEWLKRHDLRRAP